MGNIKSYGAFLVSLLVALIVLRFVLKTGSKAPIVGGVIDKADQLAFE
jgi:hypothetical protein